MRVIHQSPTALIVEERPWGTPLVALWLAGICGFATLQDATHAPGYDTVVLFLLSCLFMSVIWIVGQATRLTLDSRAGQILIERRSLTGWKKMTLPMDRLHYAEAEVNGRDSSNAWRRLTLVTKDQERMPVTLGFDDNEASNNVAEQINHWLGVPVTWDEPKSFLRRAFSI